MYCHRLLAPTVFVLAGIVAALPGSVGAQPANDNCTAPAVIAALPYSDTQDTTAATTEPSDPTPSCGSFTQESRSVWYSFTPTSAGTVTATTFASNYDTVLSAYTGTCGLETLVEVQGSCSDDVDQDTWSQRTFAVTANTPYLFEVASFEILDGGTLRFALQWVTPAPNDDCGTPVVATSLPFTSAVDTTSATTAASDPLSSCGSPGTQDSNSVWYKFTAASNGTAHVTTFGSTYDTVLTAYTGTCATPTKVACNDDAGLRTQSDATFGVTAGTSYLMEVTEYGAVGSGGILQLGLDFMSGATPTPTPTPTAAPPSACANRIVIPAEGGAFTGSIAESGSTAAGSCGLADVSSEQVFEWTPNTSGTATIQTCGGVTNFDSIVYVRVTKCETGVEIGCNDDACDVASRLTATVTAGQTYFIFVDGFGGASGDFTLSVSPPDTATPTPSPATSTPTATPGGPVCTCQGDANKNRFVNSADFAAVQANFGRPADPVTGLGDANCNGFVNSADFAAVQANFGRPCP